MHVSRKVSGLAALLSERHLSHVARGLRTLSRQRSSTTVKGVLCEGFEKAMLLSSVVDIREISGRAFIHKTRLALNIVRVSYEDS